VEREGVEREDMEEREESDDMEVDREERGRFVCVKRELRRVNMAIDR
jgi:hypothetical protein